MADVLLRRTRVGLLDAPRLTAAGSEGAQAVARAMGRPLGWDDARVVAEIDAWRALARVEGLVFADGGASSGSSKSVEAEPERA